MKMWMTLISLSVASATGIAQETVRHVEGSGRFTKHLTPGLLDNWVLDGDSGETIIAHVSTKEFDPILELAAQGEPEDKVLFSVDDKGSESRFSFRLPKKGTYKIRIHAFKYKGGGNYALRIRRFQATPIAVGKRVVGTIDRRGNSHHYFSTTKGQILVPELKGASSRSLEILDGKGRPMRDWSGTVLVEDNSMHSVVVSGRAGNRYELVIRKATLRNLDERKKLTGRLSQYDMDVWTFEGMPGDFRFLEVETNGQLASRLVYAPRKTQDTQRIARTVKRPEIQFMRVGSKGARLRFAAVLGRRGRYQLQLLAQTPTTYDLKMNDASSPIETGQSLRGNLSIGGSSFYRFEARPGQLFRASVVSDRFDSFLRLYNSRGDLVQEDDDGNGGTGSRITQMIMQKDTYRLQLSSLGNGGGGSYDVGLRELKVKELKTGQPVNGKLNPNGTDYWSFSGKEGKTVLFHVSSADCDTLVRLYGPNGVNLGNDDNGGVGTNSLLAVRLPETGQYTVWISSRRGAGNYRCRLIDGD